MAKLDNYKGSVSLISGITQANNGDFPLVEAAAVMIDEDDTRLDAFLERFINMFKVTVDVNPTEETFIIRSNSSIVIDECIHLFNTYNAEEVMACLK